MIRVRTRALRRGVWFRALTGAERAVVDLTIRVVERVRSLLLAKVLTSIVKKLLDAMEGEVGRLMRTVGRSLARRLSGIARARIVRRHILHSPNDKLGGTRATRP